MFNFKTVVFFVFIIAVCSVHSKNTLRIRQSTNPPPEIFDFTLNKPSPLDAEIHRFENLLADAEGEDQEHDEHDEEQDFADFVEREFRRSDRSGDGMIDLDEYKGRLDEVAHRYFVKKEFADLALAEFDQFNYDNEGKSKDVIDEEEFADLIEIAIEALLPMIKELKGSKYERVFNLRGYLERLSKRPDETVPCNDKDASDFILHKLDALPLKKDIVDNLIRGLVDTNIRDCKEEEKIMRIL